DHEGGRRVAGRYPGAVPCGGRVRRSVRRGPRSGARPRRRSAHRPHHSAAEPTHEPRRDLRRGSRPRARRAGARTRSRAAGGLSASASRDAHVRAERASVRVEREAKRAAPWWIPPRGLYVLRWAGLRGEAARLRCRFVKRLEVDLDLDLAAEQDAVRYRHVPVEAEIRPIDRQRGGGTEVLPALSVGHDADQLDVEAHRTRDLADG